MWALRYAPLVAPDPLDGLVIDIAGAAHLHGGEAALVGDLSERLTRSGLTARAAVADTWAAAWGLARFAAAGTIAPPGETMSIVADLPVAALRLDTNLVAALADLGIDTVGELAGTPRVSLALRFGPPVTSALDRLAGRTAEFIEPVLAPSIPHATLRFAEPLMHANGLAIALEKLAAALCADLETAGLGARRLDLRFRRVDNQVAALRITRRASTSGTVVVTTSSRPMGRRACSASGGCRTRRSSTFAITTRSRTRTAAGPGSSVLPGLRACAGSSRGCSRERRPLYHVWTAPGVQGGLTQDGWGSHALMCPAC